MVASDANLTKVVQVPSKTTTECAAAGVATVADAVYHNTPVTRARRMCNRIHHEQRKTLLPDGVTTVQGKVDSQMDEQRALFRP